MQILLQMTSYFCPKWRKMDIYIHFSALHISQHSVSLQCRQTISTLTSELHSFGTLPSTIFYVCYFVSQKLFSIINSRNNCIICFTTVSLTVYRDSLFSCLIRKPGVLKECSSLCVMGYWTMCCSSWRRSTFLSYLGPLYSISASASTCNSSLNRSFFMWWLSALLSKTMPLFCPTSGNHYCTAFGRIHAIGKSRHLSFTDAIVLVRPLIGEYLSIELFTYHVLFLLVLLTTMEPQSVAAMSGLLSYLFNHVFHINKLTSLTQRELLIENAACSINVSSYCILLLLLYVLHLFQKRIWRCITL